MVVFGQSLIGLNEFLVDSDQLLDVIFQVLLMVETERRKPSSDSDDEQLATFTTHSLFFVDLDQRIDGVFQVLLMVGTERRKPSSDPD